MRSVARKGRIVERHRPKDEYLESVAIKGVQQPPACLSRNQGMHALAPAAMQDDFQNVAAAEIGKE